MCLPLLSSSPHFLRLAACEFTNITRRYYVRDVSYRHPFFAVPRSANSRPALVGLFQWFRIVSPKYHVEVEQVTYDQDKDELFLVVVTTFRPRLSIFRAAPSRCVSFPHLRLLT